MDCLLALIAVEILYFVGWGTRSQQNKDCNVKQENGLQKCANHSLLKFFSMHPKSHTKVKKITRNFNWTFGLPIF